MVRFKLNTTDLRDLGVKARENGHGEAARVFFESKPFGKPFVEVRVAVMLPNATSREAYDATALAAAAALAEDDVKRLRIMETASFKVEVRYRHLERETLWDVHFSIVQCPST